MIRQEISIGGKNFRLNLTDQIIMQVNHLKSLYNTAYEDPESFRDVSSEISNTINEISKGVEPPASDNELDSVIQAIMEAVAKKSAEAEEASKAHKKGSKTPGGRRGRPAKKSKLKK